MSVYPPNRMLLFITEFARLSKVALADKDVRPAGGEEVDHNRGRSDRKDLSSSSLPSRELPRRLCANRDGQRDQEDGPSFGGGQAVCHAALGHSRPGEMLIDSKFRPDLPQEEFNSLVNIYPTSGGVQGGEETGLSWHSYPANWLQSGDCHDINFFATAIFLFYYSEYFAFRLSLTLWPM